jgi:hypothetical protein
MTDTTDGEVPFFDAARAVAEYRGIIDKRDAATDAIAKDEYDRMASIARTRWAEWQGEDSIHEMAFGEPED